MFRGEGEGRLEYWEELATKEPRAELIYPDVQCGAGGKVCPQTRNHPVADLGGVRGPHHSQHSHDPHLPLFKTPQESPFRNWLGDQVSPQNRELDTAHGSRKLRKMGNKGLYKTGEGTG